MIQIGNLKNVLGLKCALEEKMHQNVSVWLILILLKKKKKKKGEKNAVLDLNIYVELFFSFFSIF